MPDNPGLGLLKQLGKNRKIANTLVGEAVGDGEKGMQAVFDVMRNQSKFFGQTLEETAKTKYSAYRRPDLADFVGKQPKKLVNAAHKIVNDNAPDGTGGALHFENIEKYGIPIYAKKEGGYIPLKFEGDHTFFVTLREYRILVERGVLPPGLEANVVTNKEQHKNARTAYIANADAAARSYDGSGPAR